MSNGNYRLDPGINNVLSTQQVAQINALVNKYNTLPQNQRISQSYHSVSRVQTGNTPYAVTGGGGGCSYHWSLHTYWWGNEFYLNGCVVNWLHSIENDSEGTILGSSSVR